MMGWLVSAVSPVVSYRLWFVSRRVYDMGWLVSAVSPVVSYRLWFVSRRVYDGVASVSSQSCG